MPNVPIYIKASRSITHLGYVSTDILVEDILLEVGASRAEYACPDEKEDASGGDKENVQGEAGARSID